MPFDTASARFDLPAAELHGVPRAALVRHALGQLAPGLRDAVAEIELEEGGRFVNMGMNFDRVAWRAVWRHAGLPAASGSIPVRRGEIA